MGKIYNHLPEHIQNWIATQPIFFVASAPLSAEGSVNLSPKGQDSFRVLAERRVAYIDLTGSGIETIAHVKENERLTIMFCAFEGPPQIVRLFGKATVHQKDTPDYEQLKMHFPYYLNARAIIVSDLFRVTTACGYAVPLMQYQADRDVLDKSAAKKGAEGLAIYRKENNRESWDGLKGLDF